jgi:hypothetical protein
MSRRSNRNTKIILWVISILVIGSMVCGVLASIFAPDGAFGMVPAIEWAGALI